MYIAYQLGVYLYYALLLLLSPFNPKAKKWVDGRRAQKKLFEQALPKAKRIWFHFASLGEFEQGRIILEKINKIYPEYKFVISFFSPSGYEVRKNYALAEKVYYLPIDSPKNAKKFINHIQPSLIFFNKYEYWYSYIKEAKTQGIPLFVSSAIFRTSQLFFKPYGGFQRQILRLVHHFFVQNKPSEELLKSIHIQQFSLCGDTRFDRVYEHAQVAEVDKKIIDFCGNKPVFVAGSTWSADELLIQNLLVDFPEMKLIIVPHEISDSHIQQITTCFKNESLCFTELNENNYFDKNVLIVNTIGMLSSIYKIAKYCYIGGGFGSGIHNTLEAAAFGKPIFFGPKYSKFQEAKDLVSLNAAKSVQHYKNLKEEISMLNHSEELYYTTCELARNYVSNNYGASDKIIAYLQSNNYLH